MRRQKQGLLLYTGSGLSHMVDPFTGVYAASKAAGDSVAQIMALETSRYGIETLIVMPGAFTTGTEHFKHAVGPTDREIALQYDLLGGLGERLASMLDSLNEPGVRTDPERLWCKLPLVYVFNGREAFQISSGQHCGPQFSSGDGFSG
jgi:NAD(P)-dependent dehydrogenase (short-subunit alcohol dehydrogenase family)